MYSFATFGPGPRSGITTLMSRYACIHRTIRMKCRLPVLDGKFFRLTGRSFERSPRRPSRIASRSYARRCCNQASPNMPVANCLSAFEIYVVLVSFFISPRRKSTFVSYRKFDQLNGVWNAARTYTLSHIVHGVSIASKAISVSWIGIFD